jgi:hypothetical protein
MWSNFLIILFSFWSLYYLSYTWATKSLSDIKLQLVVRFIINLHKNEEREREGEWDEDHVASHYPSKIKWATAEVKKKVNL